MRLVHLVAALASMAVLIVSLIGGYGYAQGLERGSVHGLAPQLFQQKMQGSVLQIEAFRQPDLLPLYGSSELDSYQGPYHPSELFRTHPRGFSIFPVGRKGTTALTVLQDLAAVGSDLHGKKVAISVLFGWFFSDAAEPDYYAGNFSRLHANALAFSTDLSFGLKQAAARRMLEFEDTLEHDPLLKFGLERLADDSPLSRALYSAVLPLGKLQTAVLFAQDHWQTIAYIRQNPPGGPDIPYETVRPDWSSLRLLAEREAQEQASNNPFGFENQAWELLLTRSPDKVTEKKSGRGDPAFVQSVQEAVGWTDLELLLRGLAELGAEPLILSAPVKGAYYDFRGVSATARAGYYRRLHELADPYGVPLLDFSDHDGDRYFVADRVSHLSGLGWIYYAEALDAFHHGTLR